MTYNTTNFTNNYKNINTTILNNQFVVFRRANSTILNTQQLNQFTLSTEFIPNINIKRNNARLTNTVKALTAFIQIQSNLPNSTIVALVALLHNLEMMYYRDLKGFVPLCKLLSNWYKVNLARNIRKQDKIPNTQWSAIASLPVMLIGIGEEISRVKSQENLMMIHRLVLSIFDIYQVILTPGLPKLETITQEYTGNETIIDSLNIDRALERLNISPDLITQQLEMANAKAEWHASSASGPNGQAVWMSHIDAQALKEDQNLLNIFSDLSNLLGREDLLVLLDQANKLPGFFTQFKEDPKHSKLHFIYEKGDKVRTIAILDWWTQELLAPFHKVVADSLKTIDMDGTFDQDSIADKVKSFTADPNVDIFSLDLTAATDRLPIRLQSRILDHLIKIEGFGKLWARLLTERDFTLPGGDTIRYKVGQPMGAKSSFVMLGLTHHIIVQEAAALAGFASFNSYVILGDDVAIANKLVAEHYKEIMKSLGMEIVSYKSIESIKGTTQFQIAEICKRLYANGLEISPVPVKLLANIIETPDMAYQFQEEMSKRGLIVDSTKWGTFMAAILRNKDAFIKLAQLNILPGYMTGMKSQINLFNDNRFTLQAFLDSKGITESTLNAFFMYTVLLEQMKRMSNIIQNSETTFDILSKAMKVSNIPAIGYAPESMVKQNQFVQDHMDKWGIVKVMHPAREVMFNEVNRISTFIMQLSVTHGYNLINSLLNNLIDSLKISVIEMVKDTDLGRARVTRTLIDKTLQNIDAALKEQSKTLDYSVKFNPMNVIWFMKVTINGSCTVSRSQSKISVTFADANIKHKDLVNTISMKDIFAFKETK